MLVNSLIRCGRLGECVGPLRGLLQVDPTSSEGSATLVQALLANGDVDGAIAECERRVAIVPDDAPAWADLASLREQRGDRDGASRAAASGLAICERTGECDEATLGALRAAAARGERGGG
jgi:predicted Zn-dependent protease